MPYYNNVYALLQLLGAEVGEMAADQTTNPIIKHSFC